MSSRPSWRRWTGGTRFTSFMETMDRRYQSMLEQAGQQQQTMLSQVSQHVMALQSHARPATPRWKAGTECLSRPTTSCRHPRTLKWSSSAAWNIHDRSSEGRPAAADSSSLGSASARAVAHFVLAPRRTGCRPLTSGGSTMSL